MIARRALIAAAALALAAPAAARDSGQWTTVSAVDLARAFRAICLDHPGDAEAQAAIGQADPWNLTQQEEVDSNGRTGYRTGKLQLGVTVKGDTRVCALTTGFPLGGDGLAALAARVSPVLRSGDYKLLDDMRAAWSVDTPYGKQEARLSVKDAPEIGMKVSTLIIVIENVKAI